MKRNEKMERSLIGVALFTLLLIVVLFYPPFRSHAQAPAGFTKITTIASGQTTTYTDTSASLSTTYAYVVTATNGALESVPSIVVYASLPATAPTTANPACGGALIHCVSLNWVAATSGTPATGFNVYRQVATSPNPPGGLTAVTN
jgi:hypothetical protein